VPGPHYGVDVSSNNAHPINWPALFTYLSARGGGAKPFAIIKISQGTGYVNPDASGDIAAAKAAGFVVGGYLMDQGNDDPAAEEAVFRANSAGVPQFDDDELPEGLSTQAYIAHLQSLVAQDPGAPDYLNQSEEDEGFPAEAGIWEANYNGQPGVTHRPGVLIHQFTATGQVPGCAGEFDLNCWLGSEAQFSQFFGLPLPGGMQMGDFPGAVAAEITADGNGAWVVTPNGNVYTAGDAQEYGTLTTDGVTDVDDIVGIFRSWAGNGYYLLGADGAVYAFGDAAFHGSYPGLPAADTQGQRSFGGGSLKLHFGGTGYTLVALDGSRYGFGS